MEKRPYFPALDGLRALAVGAVFAHHYLAILLPQWLRYGWAGVDVFFVLSGFLITGILYDSRSSSHRWRNFYIRRTLRIFPLYYGILLVLLLTTPLFHWQWSVRWLSFPAYVFNFMPRAVPGHPDQVLGYLTGMVRGKTYVSLVFFHFWTLCVEEQFYLVWPAVIFLVGDRKKLLQILAALIPCVLLLRCGLMATSFGHAEAERVISGTYARVDSLLMGGALALLLRGAAAERVMRWGGALFALGVGALAATGVFGVYVMHQSSLPDQTTPWIASVGITPIGIAACGLLLLTLREGTRLNRVLQTPPLRWLGQRSYGIYVFHMIPMGIASVAAYHIAVRIHPSSTHTSPLTVLLQTMLAMVSTMIAAAVSYRFYERPFLKLKDRWTATPPRSATRQILEKDVAHS